MKDNSSPAEPVILWFSDPVGPDETVLLQGDNFSDDAVVEFAIVSNSAGTGETSMEWHPVKPLQRSSQSLKAVVPSEWSPGLFACRVMQNGSASASGILNAPDVWWIQGNGGNAGARPGSWLRVLGKCLNLGGSQVALASKEGERIPLTLTKSTGYSLSTNLPEKLAPGDYVVWVHNGAGGEAGWRGALTLNVQEAKPARSSVLNVQDFGADPDGRKDCTLAIIQALESLAGLGGGVLYFPRGRYRIDSILRSGMWISHAIRIPQGVTLRGESADLVTLWWPDQKEPLPTLLEGSSNFGVEDLSIYTQGRHRNIISGESNARIRRVRIRANCYYMTNENGGAHHERGIAEAPSKMGTALEFWGSNIEITDCDIYHSAAGFNLKHVRGGWIANNMVHAANMVFISGGEGVIFENNSYVGNSLTGGGNNIALHFGATSCRHVFYGHNRTSHIYGGDHEALTLDGHGTAYIGSAETKGSKVILASDPILGVDGCKDNLKSLDDTTIFILDGKGAGQYRSIFSFQGRELKIDRPWTVEPDASSVFSVGSFNGRHLIIGNIAQDSGALVQLYPPNCECIVAENEGYHSSGMSSLSKFGINEKSRFPRIEPSWFNQFLDNRIVWGNGWGGGETEVDRWIGGEGYLNIWGWQVSFCNDQYGHDQDRLLTSPDLAKFLGKPEQPRTIPLSRGQIVRRHLIDNSSSIRIRGAVTDVLIEKCVIQKSRNGIRVDNEPERKHSPGVDMLQFEPEGPVSAKGQAQPFLSPQGVLLRKNEMNEVKIPFSGTALEFAQRE